MKNLEKKRTKQPPECPEEWNTQCALNLLKMAKETLKPVRVFIITQDEPVYAPVYLDQIIQKSRHTFVGITALSPAGKKGWLQLARHRLAMYGLRDFLRASSLYFGCRLRSYFPGKYATSRLYSVRQVASKYEIPMLPCSNVNDAVYLDALKALDIDILLSVAANQRFKNNLLKVPGLASLNVHSALLPKYRGMDGLFWALAHGESLVGVTVHLMNDDFDAGAIIAQQSFPVANEDSLHTLYFKAIKEGSSLVAGALDDFASGNVVTRPNDVESGSYFSAPTPEAVQQFRKFGRRFF